MGSSNYIQVYASSHGTERIYLPIPLAEQLGHEWWISRQGGGDVHSRRGRRGRWRRGGDIGRPWEEWGNRSFNGRKPCGTPPFPPCPHGEGETNWTWSLWASTEEIERSRIEEVPDQRRMVARHLPSSVAFPSVFSIGFIYSVLNWKERLHLLLIRLAGIDKETLVVRSKKNILNVRGEYLQEFQTIIPVEGIEIIYTDIDDIMNFKKSKAKFMQGLLKLEIPEL